MSILYRPHRIEPMPPQFPEQFVIGGYRRVENLFNGRSAVIARWLEECGADRLRSLRRRYMRGDLAALDEARCLLTTLAVEGGARLEELIADLSADGRPQALSHRERYAISRASVAPASVKAEG